MPFCYWRFTWIAIFYIYFALSLKLRLKTVKFKKGKTAITYLFSSNQCLAPTDTDEEHWQSQYHLPHSLSQFWKEVCTTLIMVKCTFYISNLKQGNFKYYPSRHTTSYRRWNDVVYLLGPSIVHFENGAQKQYAQLTLFFWNKVFDLQKRTMPVDIALKNVRSCTKQTMG